MRNKGRHCEELGSALVHAERDDAVHAQRLEPAEIELPLELQQPDEHARRTLHLLGMPPLREYA